MPARITVAAGASARSWPQLAERIRTIRIDQCYLGGDNVGVLVGQEVCGCVEVFCAPRCLPIVGYQLGAFVQVRGVAVDKKHGEPFRVSTGLSWGHIRITRIQASRPGPAVKNGTFSILGQ
jgi:hypothetical protein